MKAYNIRVGSSYKKWLLVSILFVIAVILVVLYFSLTKVVITITPKLKKINTEFFLEAGSDNLKNNSSNFIKADIKELTVEKTDSFVATGTKMVDTIQDDGTVGTVTLYNNLDKPIDLVRRTRLLSEKNVLVRLKKRVTIPANGSIEVEVYTDNPDDFEGLDTGKLTIPGLSKSLQEKVYGENNKLVSKNRKIITIVDKEDVEKAVASLTNQVLQENLNKLKSDYGSDGPKVLSLKGELLSKTMDKPIGAPADNFELTVKMRIIVVFMDKSDLNKLAMNSLKNKLQKGEKIMNIDFDSSKFIIDRFDKIDKVATIRVKAVGEVSITKDSPILDKTKIIGANKKQVEIYFKSFDAIKDVDVKFSPFWVKRVPNMLDKIDIIVM